jgi:hypothetical protein
MNAEKPQHLVSAWVDRRLSDRLSSFARENERSVSAELRIAIRERLERAGERTAA